MRRRLKDSPQMIIGLKQRHYTGIERLEGVVYPKHMQLEDELLDDVIREMSAVVLDENGCVAAYILIEEGEEVDNAICVADIVRTSRSKVSGADLCQWALARFMDSELEYVEVECRSTSVHLLEACGLEIEHREDFYCEDRQENITGVLLRKPTC